MHILVSSSLSTACLEWGIFAIVCICMAYLEQMSACFNGKASWGGRMKLSHPYKVILSGHNGALQSPPIGLISPTHSTFQFQVSLLIQYYTLPVSQTSLLSIDLSCVIHHLISCMSKWHVNPYSSVEEDERKEMASLFGGEGGGGFSGTFFLSLYCRVVLGWLYMSGREVGCDTWLQCFNSFRFYRVHHYIFFCFCQLDSVKEYKDVFSFKLWKVELYSTTSLSPYSCSGNFIFKPMI